MSNAYQSAEAFLLSLVNYEKQSPPAVGNTKDWHMKAFAGLLEKLGNPQSAYPIIHVAGTKGKGSTTRFIATLLGAMGYQRVGVFTSPHIESFRERIAIDNVPITEDDFATTLDSVRAHLPTRDENDSGFRTTFETLTAMALHHFREKKCEVVVLETGLGGRLDATNVVTAKVALLTAIGYDHQRVLGNTMQLIAAEKAGIITPGTGIALIGPQPTRRMKIMRVAAKKQAIKSKVPLQTYDVQADPVPSFFCAEHGFRLNVRALGLELNDVQFHLLGRHQIDNLRAALLACEAFIGTSKTVSAEQLRAGIEACVSPGRLEIVRENPPALVDGAHCPLSAAAAIKAIEAHFPGKKVVIILGVLADKNHEDILRHLAQCDCPLLLTYTPSSPRALNARDLELQAAPLFPNVRSCASPEEAVQIALNYQSRHPKTVVLCTGTFYGIAAVRNALQTHK
ncbi:TPA: hypothetical protein DDW35_06420 [Candidatus Sumerlaeota bacterium]|jgi:dihydrofolate synthase / folylpolyglutamate synthase|nr:hypothetical protein [Candidatus Sumerlaeota bacterium]